MEFTREIYWNVGHGLTTLGPMYGLLLVALVLFAIGFLKRIKVYRLGQPLDRTDQRGEEIRTQLVENRLRDAGLPADPIPGGDIEPANALLGDRGDVRHARTALGGGNCQGTDLARDYLRIRSG